MNIFTVLFFGLLTPIAIAAAIVMATGGLFALFWAMLALPSRFAFGRDWAVASSAGATACVLLAGLAMMLMPDRTVMLYHAARGVLGV